jgi:hypothetical protein
MQALNATPWFKELLADHQPPCISIYHPVGRTTAPGNQNPVHFQNILNEVRETIGGKTGYGHEHAQAALKQLESVLNDANLWAGDREAVAIFCSADHAHVIDLRTQVERIVNVADSFHVKPLIRALQQAQTYRVLAISPHTVRLFEGDQFSLRGMKLPPNVPTSIDDRIAVMATGTDTTPQSSTGGRPAATDQNFFAPGTITFDRFCRMVDHAIWEALSQFDHIPIIVCADVKNLSDFLNVTKNEYVMKTGIQLSAEAADPDRLREEAWKLIAPRFEQEIQTLKDAYQAAKARHLGSDEVPQVAEAAAVGRVGTLLVDSDARVPGILNRASGLIEQAPMSNPRADDVLDDLAEMVLKMDGQVFVLPHDQMPNDHGLAAIYRY